VHYFFIIQFLLAAVVMAQVECVPFNPEDTKLVDRGPVKTVVGPLAKFNPCHRIQPKLQPLG
jgi:hypothetical protein